MMERCQQFNLLVKVIVVSVMCTVLWAAGGILLGLIWYCVPSNFMANRRAPKFSLNNCAQSSKKDVYVP